jgi:hypothetical protein
MELVGTILGIDHFRGIVTLLMVNLVLVPFGLLCQSPLP